MTEQIIREETEKAVLQAEETMKQLSYVAGLIHGQMCSREAELTKIAAKRTLGMRLNQRERAMWVLYGPQGR